MSTGDVAETRLSFDDILEAVQDSKRGRWFLDEYRNRLRKEESGRILHAISKIETRLEAMPGAPEAAVELAKVKAAIATTRSDIAKLDLAGANLSPEGRLFANLAELARKALPHSDASKATPNLAPGIVRALKLVETLDESLNGQSSKEQAPAANTYFNRDEDLFEPQPKPAASPAKAAVPAASIEPIVKPPAPKGAKFVIVKSDETPSEPTADAAPAPQADQPAPMETPRAVESALAVETTPIAPPASKPAAEPEDIRVDTPRIVIIRRKPEDMAEVVLEEEKTAETAA